jgi:PST family polysaccharide transporter
MGHILWTIVTIGAAYALNDYRCMLVGILVGSLGYTITTHLISREPWRLGWSKSAAREAMIYGAPLVPNGIALAVAGMGDRFLIGSLLGVVQLAFYNTSSMAAFMPRSVVLRLLSAVAMPLFLKKGRDRAISERTMDYYGLALSVIASMYSLVFVCFGSLLITILFGAKYSPEQLLVTSIALSAFMKSMIKLPEPLALVYGQTGLVLTSTIVSSLALPCAAASVLLERDLTTFVFGLVAGEFIAAVWIVSRSIAIYRFQAKLMWFNTLFPVLVLAVAHVMCSAMPAFDFIPRIGVFIAGALALVAGYAVAAAATKLDPRGLMRPETTDVKPHVT